VDKIKVGNSHNSQIAGKIKVTDAAVQLVMQLCIVAGDDMHVIIM